MNKPPAKKIRKPASKSAPEDHTMDDAKTASEVSVMVPSPDVATSYKSRKFPGGHTDMELLAYAYQNKHNVLLEGHTGSGKTSAFMAFASSTGLPFYAVPSNVGIEPSQLFGKYIPDETNGGFVWQDGPVTTIVRTGGVLLINEVNFMPERIATTLFGLLDGRRAITLLDHKAEVIRVHEGTGCWCGANDCNDKRVLVGADMNPDYEGTRDLNKAFRNRFAIQLQWDYDASVEVSLVKSKALRNMADQIRQQVNAGTIETPVSTNMLMEFERLLKGLSPDFARVSFLQHFSDADRGPVTQVFQTYEDNIKKELLPPASAPGPVVDNKGWAISDDVPLTEADMDFFYGDEKKEA